MYFSDIKKYLVFKKGRLCKKRIFFPPAIEFSYKFNEWLSFYFIPSPLLRLPRGFSLHLPNPYQFHILLCYLIKYFYIETKSLKTSSLWTFPCPTQFMKSTCLIFCVFRLLKSLNPLSVKVFKLHSRLWKTCHVYWNQWQELV